MNHVWLDFKEKVEKYSSDTSELLEKKKMYIIILPILMLLLSLFSVDDVGLNVLTIEALQIILVNFFYYN